MIKPRVFLDTNVLIKAFLKYRDNKSLPFYLADPDAMRYTFEKCIFECYMIFRDVGKKKSGEKNNWSQKYLDKEKDARSLPDLANKYHGSDMWLASYWINQIEELLSSELHWKEPGFKDLLRNRDLFENLCDNFRKMIKDYDVKVLSYYEIFGTNDQFDYADLGGIHPIGLDVLARTTIIPSEDFEIVYAALRLRADIFVTDDHTLQKCSGSLGLNLALSPNAFCSGEKYVSKVSDWRETNSY